MLDRDRTEVRFNSEWLDMPAQELFELVGKVTVARLLERDDFSKRMAADEPISALELLYPIMQGYDSVAIRSDVELGGTDQKFNLLFGRDVQRAYGVPEQSIMTMPILPGLDGERRMSKSLGNYVGVTEPPEEIFGKVMSIPDSVMPLYYELLLGTGQPGDATPGRGEAGTGPAARRALPRRGRRRVRRGRLRSGARAARGARGDARGAPGRHRAGNGDDGAVHMPALIAGAFGISSSEARRLLGQGGVKLDGEGVDADRLDLPRAELEGRVLQVGKRRFARLVA